LLIDAAHGEVFDVDLLLTPDRGVEVIDDLLHLVGFAASPLFPVADDDEARRRLGVAAARAARQERDGQYDQDREDDSAEPGHHASVGVGLVAAAASARARRNAASCGRAVVSA